MKNFCAILSTLLLSTSSMLAQNADKFQEFHTIERQYGFGSKQTLSFLNQWEKEEPNNAEMLYCWYLDHFLQANQLIEQSENLNDFKNSAMLPDTITRFGELQIKNFWIMKDKGDGMMHYKKALEYMQKAISLHPNILELYSNKTDGFIRKNEFKYAASTLLDVIELDRENHNRWTDFYGKPFGEQNDMVVSQYIQETFGALIGKNEFSLAEFICDTLISLYPNKLDYQFDKGIIYLQSFQKEKALQHFLQLNEQFPNEGNLHRVLATIYQENGDIENMKKYATLLLQNADPQWSSIGQELLSSLEPFKIDFQEIQKWYQNNSEEFLMLEKRFKDGDTSLNLNELANVYFAHACTEQCKGTKLWPVSLDSLLKAENFKECYEESKKCIEQHPASIAALAYIVVP